MAPGVAPTDRFTCEVRFLAGDHHLGSAREAIKCRPVDVDSAPTAKGHPGNTDGVAVAVGFGEGRFNQAPVEGVRSVLVVVGPCGSSPALRHGIPTFVDDVSA